MEQTTHLWLFFVMVFGVVLLPGLDMAFVLASALVGGRRSGLAATAGIIAGGVCHVTLGALGIMAVLKLFPAAFNLVLIAGALYIAWIGWSLLGSNAALGAIQTQAARPSQAATFRQGMLTNLLNPKAYLFMLAIFPQFLKPEYGELWVQAIVLWLIIPRPRRWSMAAWRWRGTAFATGWSSVRAPTCCSRASSAPCCWRWRC